MAVGLVPAVVVIEMHLHTRHENSSRTKMGAASGLQVHARGVGQFGFSVAEVYVSDVVV